MILMVRHALLRRAFVLGSAIVLALAIGACGAPREPAPAPGPDTTAASRADSLAARDTIAVQDTITYRYVRVPVVSAKKFRKLSDSVGVANMFEVLKINRVDLAHVRDRDSLIVPETFGDSLTFSPFPRRIEAMRDTAKLLLISLRVQAFAAYDSGRLVKWGPTSTGREEMPTPVGLYHTNWKDKDRISTFDDEWILKWYVNLDNFQGVSLHEYELPGRPASHSCVRLLQSDAMWMYAWAEQWQLSLDPRVILREGTPAVVFGEWKWKHRAPWKRLPEDPNVTTLNAAEIDDALRVLYERVKPQYPKRPPGAPAVTTPTRRDSVAGSRDAPADTSKGR